MNLSQRFDLAALSKGATRRKQVKFRPIGARLSFETSLYRIAAELAPRLQAVRPDILHAAARMRSDLVLDNALDSVMAELERSFAQVIALSRRKVDSLFQGEARRHDETWMQQVNRVVGVDLKAVVRSDQVQPALDLAVRKNVALIKGLSEEVQKRVETQVIDLVSRGASNKEIAKVLGEIGGFTKNRAKLIAIDQASSFNAHLNQIRQTQAGISKYVWSTSHDSRVRPLHRQRDGQTFRWDSPPSDGHPGEPVRCRCTAMAVLDYEDAPKRQSGRQRASEAGLAAVQAALGL